MMTKTEALANAIIAAGLAPGTFNLSVTEELSEATISFNPSVPTHLRVAAQNVIDTFDWSDAAHLVRLNAQLRQFAQAAIDGERTPVARLLVATFLLTLDEINILRAWVTSFKSQVAQATSLTNLQTRVAALDNVPQRTRNQLVNAVIAKITAGDADAS